MNTRPGGANGKTMIFDFEKASVSDIVSQMAKEFGITFVQPGGGVPGTLTIHVAEPLTQVEAMKLFNSMLVPLGYASEEITAVGSDRKIVRIFPVVSDGKQHVSSP